jgi:hydroxypyruvate reductase
VPPPDHPAFRRVTIEMLADNRTACAGAVRAARARGYDAALHETQLAGEARALGTRIATTLRAEAERTRGGPGTVHVWGGEAAVTLHDAPPDALGGRMQELALSAAHTLDVLAAGRVTLLAAGTDGRDGPTDAAGAVVDGETWARITATGRDPASDLAAHRSHAALDAAGALLRTGSTGTNVADLVIALVTG